MASPPRVTETRPFASPNPVGPPTCSDLDGLTDQDVVRRLVLALSILDHRVNTRDRYHGPARDRFLRDALTQARAALDGATIETLEARGA